MRRLKPKLGKASASGSNPGREHIRHRHPHNFNDLFFEERLEVGVLGTLAGLRRRGVIMRGANKHFLEAVFLPAGPFHILTGEHRQVRGDECQTFSAGLQNETARINRIVDRFVCFGRNADFGGPGAELARLTPAVGLEEQNPAKNQGGKELGCFHNQFNSWS